MFVMQFIKQIKNNIIIKTFLTAYIVLSCLCLENFALINAENKILVYVINQENNT